MNLWRFFFFFSFHFMCVRVDMCRFLERLYHYRTLSLLYFGHFLFCTCA